MAGLKIGNMKLRAASLIEAIVASVVFMLVFAISIDMVTRVSARGDETGLMRMEMELDEAVTRCRSEFMPEGEFTESYSWGTINVKVERYRGYAEVNRVDICARHKSSGKQLEHVMIVCSE